MMRFAKYHGFGNDFILFADPGDELELRPELVRRLCDRRFGVGADGVIRVAPAAEGGDLFMDYVNRDGSVGEMCGNGIRCLAVFAREERLISEDVVKVETRAGLKVVEVTAGGKVRVDMGAPIFNPREIPVLTEDPDALHVRVEVDGAVTEVASVSMGNPHAVLFVEDPATAPVASLGPSLETHEMFPKGTNVEFVRVLSPERLRMRVWERGAGETLACGTGACAAAVVARQLADTSGRMIVELPGGELEIEWEGSLERAQPVFMTGPVQKVFEGEVELDPAS